MNTPYGEVPAEDLLIGSGNIASLTLFINLNFTNRLCISGNSGTSDKFLFGIGNDENALGSGGFPDALIQCGRGVTGTPCNGTLGTKSGHLNVSGQHITLAQEDLDKDECIVNFSHCW